jgi:hypothetical protein
MCPQNLDGLCTTKAEKGIYIQVLPVSLKTPGMGVGVGVMSLMPMFLPPTLPAHATGKTASLNARRPRMTNLTKQERAEIRAVVAEALRASGAPWDFADEALQCLKERGFEIRRKEDERS